MSLDGWVGDVTYVTVACKGPKRFFDLDAVRTPFTDATIASDGYSRNTAKFDERQDAANGWPGVKTNAMTHAGAPPLDWHLDNPTYTPPPRTDGDPMPLEYRVGDVFDRLAEIPDGTIDLIVTSPPFLALRSYLPADHPDKAKEIGSESTPAAFIDTLLQLTAEFGRVLAPHGSICVELGDKFSDSGGAGGDYNDNGLRAGQPKFGKAGGDGWPLPKSLTGIPTLYAWSLAYGRNLLTGQESPAGLWRIRNVIVWARPNPPVGALGDKFRPATSYITIACRSARRFFDLDAVRTPGPSMDRDGEKRGSGYAAQSGTDGVSGFSRDCPTITNHPAGAPPLDWHSDLEDGDWLWKLPTQPYKGSHYATFPLELPTRLIMAMCPLRVCTVCGKPSERIVGDTPEYAEFKQENQWDSGGKVTSNLNRPDIDFSMTRVATLGWSDCGHNTWRTGIVLDPFCGSGTTLEAAQNVGRHAIGIDLDETNADLARQRVGMFMEVDA